jgi:thioredoxin 1
MTMLISNEEEFQNEVINSKTPVVVDFYADWCHPCMAMMPVLEELSQERDLKVVKVNVDEPSAYSLVQKHGIQSIPTMFIYDNGQRGERIVGTVDKNSLSNKIP